jgi:peptidoglycan/LPS O-acetylase OafA/YrhL
MASTSQAGPELARTTSVFLDLLRIAAALTVFGSHCQLYWYGPGEMMPTISHRAVIVFFVLSGYVIAYSTFRKKRGLREYVVARLSRLYSVVAPGLLLTLVLELVGQVSHPGFYRGMSHGHEVVRYFFCATFSQAIWNNNFVPFSNGPFWSLGYEFWYYALFGAVVFIDSARWRILLTIGMGLVAGPGILLLMPCWLVGVVLYFYGRRIVLPCHMAGGGIVLFSTAFAVVAYCLPDFPLTSGIRPLLYANSFASDALVALILGGVIWFFDQAFSSMVIPEKVVKAVRFFGDHTFSLYLYHVPLVIFLGAVIPFERGDPRQAIALAGAVLAIVLVLSLYTESKRSQWARLFNWVWDRIGGWTAAIAAPGVPPRRGSRRE